MSYRYMAWPKLSGLSCAMRDNMKDVCNMEAFSRSSTCPCSTAAWQLAVDVMETLTVLVQMQWDIYSNFTKCGDTKTQSTCTCKFSDANKTFSQG